MGNEEEILQGVASAAPGDPRGRRLGVGPLRGRHVRAVRERPRLQGQLRHRGPQRADRLRVHERLPADGREGDRHEGKRADPVRARRPAGDGRLLRVGREARSEDRRRRPRLVQRPVPAALPQGRDHLLGTSGQQQSRRLDGLRCRHVPGPGARAGRGVRERADRRSGQRGPHGRRRRRPPEGGPARPLRRPRDRPRRPDQRDPRRSSSTRSAACPSSATWHSASRAARCRASRPTRT